MTVAEGPRAPLPHADQPPSGLGAGTEPGTGGLPNLCPFLATPDGTWRSARAVREHRCMAVTPPVPLAAEKQRRLCLVDAHVSCATYGAAIAARSDSPQRHAVHSRPIARMTPVILDHGRFDIRIPALPSDRATQGVLVGLLGVAFAAILLARPADQAGAGPLGVDGSSTPTGAATPDNSAGAVPTPPPSTPAPIETAAPSDEPGATPVPTASPAPSAEVSSEPVVSAQPAISGETYRVKSGDTLTAIAARFGTTAQVLAQLNDLADPSKLKVGQILNLP